MKITQLSHFFGEKISSWVNIICCKFTVVFVAVTNITYV